MARRLRQNLIALSIFALSLATGHQVLANEADAAQDSKEATTQVEFVIVHSTANYAAARRIAAKAAERLRVPLKLRDLAPTSKGGLTFPQAYCEENHQDFPCYVPRGRYDEGMYVSIEHTSAYPEFKPNLYIVVVASDSLASVLVKKAVRESKRLFPDTYTRIARIYIGCMS